MSAPSLTEQCEEAIAVLCGHDESKVRQVIEDLYDAYYIDENEL